MFPNRWVWVSYTCTEDVESNRIIRWDHFLYSNSVKVLCSCDCFALVNVFLTFAIHQRAYDYFTQAANAGNTHAMAFLGKVREMPFVGKVVETDEFEMSFINEHYLLPSVYSDSVLFDAHVFHFCVCKHYNYVAHTVWELGKSSQQAGEQSLNRVQDK